MKDRLLRYSVNILNVFCIILSLIFHHIFNISGNYIFYILCVLFAIAGFHLCVHLGIGHIVNFILKNDVDYNKSWFLERAFEDKLYKKLRVRNWKDKIPTFYPDTFSLQNNAPDKILKVMCQSEVVHTIIAILSFVPIFYAYYMNLPYKWIYIITSLMSATFDTCLVIMQRYNRPRIKRMLKRKKHI